MSMHSEVIDRIKNTISDLKISSANEAETRKRLIDLVIHEGLGWLEDDVSVEVYAREDAEKHFLDYVVSTAQTNFLVEAKPIEYNLEDLPNQRTTPLNGKWNAGAIADAIIQTRDSGRARGAGFGVTTNGVVWIVFPVSRADLTTFDGSNCYIFNLKNHPDEWKHDLHNLLSRERVIDNSLEEAFLGEAKNQVETRRLNKIYDVSYTTYRRENIFSHIENEIVTAFSDDLLSENPDLIDKAYVNTPQRIRFDERLKMHVHKRDPVWQKQPLKPMKDREHKSAVSLFEPKNISTRPAAILCLGLVGAGKTTFLHYVRNVSGKKYFEYKDEKPSPHWIYLDFRLLSKNQTPISFLIRESFQYVVQHPFLNDANRCILHAYASEIQALKSGVLSIFGSSEAELNKQIGEIILNEYKEKEPYVRKILNYASKNTPVFLIIDNVDQFDDPEIQKDIFLDAISFARDMRLNLVLSMRDFTYIKNRNSAVFDAFDFDSIYIEAPDVKSVLSKRFTIASNLLKDKSFEFYSETKRFTINDASTVIDHLRKAILDTNVGRLIEMCATGRRIAFGIDGLMIGSCG